MGNILTFPKCRQCRQAGEKLFLKATKCFTSKCAIDKRNKTPGEHGGSGKGGRLSDYGMMLREKQKVRRMYGLLERKFSSYFKEADRLKGATGENLLILLERRLDNIVYRLGFAGSRSEARQLVSHKSIKVNDHIVNIPSYLVKAGDEIKVVPTDPVPLRVTAAVEAAVQRGISDWLELDDKTLKGTVKTLPERSDLSADIKEHLIVEYYSK